MLNHIDDYPSRLTALRTWTNFHSLHQSIESSIASAVRASADLSMAEWEVLAALANQPQPLAVSEVARRTGWELSRVSRQVSRLQVRRLVERLPVPGDQRYSPVGLSDLGSVAVEQAQPAWEQAIADASPVLSAARHLLEVRQYVAPWSATSYVSPTW